MTGPTTVYAETLREHKLLMKEADSLTDPIVEKVRAQLLQRSQVGLKKYGVGLDRKDLNVHQWIDHAIEEALDLALYLTRLKEEL